MLVIYDFISIAMGIFDLLDRFGGLVLIHCISNIYYVYSQKNNCLSMLMLK